MTRASPGEITCTESQRDGEDAEVEQGLICDGKSAPAGAPSCCLPSRRPGSCCPPWPPSGIRCWAGAGPCTVQHDVEPGQMP